MPVFFNFLQIFSCLVYRDGKSDILRAKDYCGVDADYLAVKIYQRPSGVPGVYRGVCLDESTEALLMPLHVRNCGKKPRKSGDYSGGDGILEFSQSVAYGDHNRSQF